MKTTKRVRKYMGHTITSCGLSWYIDRPAGSVGGIWAPTLAAAKERIRKEKLTNPEWRVA